MAAKNNLIAWTGTAISEVDFEEFYRAELPRVYNFFRYRVGDGPQAEDLTADTFEKAWRNHARYRRDLAAFSTWLFTIARRLAQDYYRKQRASRPHGELSLDEIDERSEEDLCDRAFQPEDQIERKADFARLTILLVRLADRERELVALKYGAGLTNRAVAQLTGLSESNVGVILYRAIQTLRAGWKGNP